MNRRSEDWTRQDFNSITNLNWVINCEAHVRDRQSFEILLTAGTATWFCRYWKIQDHMLSYTETLKSIKKFLFPFSCTEIKNSSVFACGGIPSKLVLQKLLSYTTLLTKPYNVSNETNNAGAGGNFQQFCWNSSIFQMFVFRTVPTYQRQSWDETLCAFHSLEESSSLGCR